MRPVSVSRTVWPANCLQHDTPLWWTNDWSQKVGQTLRFWTCVIDHQPACERHFGKSLLSSGFDSAAVLATSSCSQASCE